jgi:hypothetical protein
MTKSLISFFVLAGALASAFGQVVAGQTDTFPTGVMNWQGANPAWVSTGGPGGAGDPFLSLTSTGSQGPGGRMAGFNSNQWIGDFTGAGIGSIDVDFKNLGAADLEMRIVFWDSTFTTQWVSNASKVLLTGSGWQHATFNLSGAGFSQFNGTTTFADTLSNTARMMFRHNPGAPSGQGVQMVANLGIDNIHATPVPEPVSIFMLGGASLLFLWRVSRNKN